MSTAHTKAKLWEAAYYQELNQKKSIYVQDPKNQTGGQSVS